MKIEVRHFADPEETISAIPGKVTVAVLADDGMAIVGDEDGPVELTLGQQANVELVGERGATLSVQAVIDPAPPIEDEPELPPVQCARPGCHHSKARHTGARAVELIKDRDSGLATACDEFGCPCGSFRETEPDRTAANVEDPRAQVIAEFLNEWRFCPVANSEGKSSRTLLDAARQLVAAMDGNPSEKDDEGESPTRVESYPFYPRTAREALLEIRRLAAGMTKPIATTAFDEVAAEGLARTAPENYELTDQLADRLAEAHKVLAELRDGGADIARLSGEIDEALALPPDLEAMIERRMKR